MYNNNIMHIHVNGLIGYNIGSAPLSILNARMFVKVYEAINDYRYVIIKTY